MVLQHEAARIGPVVRDVRPGVVSHHVVAGSATDLVARAAPRVKTKALWCSGLRLAYEPVHVTAGARAQVAAGHIGGGAAGGMRAAEVAVVGVVEGLYAAAAGWVWDAGHRTC